MEVAALLPTASEDVRRRNPALFGGAAPAKVARDHGEPGQPRPGGRRRTKAEAVAADYAKAMFPEARVLEQCLRLPLKGGGTYTPDLLILDEGAAPRVVEVKGGYRGPGWDQGYERYRRAALEWGRLLDFTMWTVKRSRIECEDWEP